MIENPYKVVRCPAKLIPHACLIRSGPRDSETKDTSGPETSPISSFHDDTPCCKYTGLSVQHQIRTTWLPKGPGEKGKIWSQQHDICLKSKLSCFPKKDSLRWYFLSTNFKSVQDIVLHRWNSLLCQSRTCLSSNLKKSTYTIRQTAFYEKTWAPGHQGYGLHPYQIILQLWLERNPRMSQYP